MRRSFATLFARLAMLIRLPQTLSRMPSSPARLSLFALLLLGLLAPTITSGAEPRNVNVILWFDTEDYLLPADDDATLRLAQMLSQRGIRATFKVVGEKARVLERRGRHDVIAALKKHDIGYHTDFHSVHPTPTEYLADCGLLDGMEEFVRREASGAADVRRIMGVSTLACYGQPGSSWAPQAVAALKQIGVGTGGTPCYVDEGSHIGIDDQPFWYANALTVFKMGKNLARMALHDPEALEPAKRKVSAVVERLRGGAGDGLISIYYHPCEWVHREFWDAVNFRRGANPPREQWRPPPQRTAAETDAAFRRFGEYVDYIRSLPGVHFVTASELPGLFPDRVRTAGVSADEFARLIEPLAQPQVAAVDMQVRDGRACSVADQLELLVLALDPLIQGGVARFPLRAEGLLGPDGPPPPSRQTSHVTWPAFRDATREVAKFIRATHRVPARVFIGPDAVPPADFLVGLARAFQYQQQHHALPLEEGVELGQDVQLRPSSRVAPDTPNLFGGWIIHKEGFRAPHLLEIARLQTWTLKPAVPKR